MPLGATRAFELFAQSAPRSRDLHLVASGGEHQLVLAEKSRLFAIDAAVAAQADAALASDDPEAVQRLLAEWGLSSAAAIDDDPPRDFRVRALSLAVAQKCNLGCSYCYARGGEFGGAAKNMPVETALRAVARKIHAKRQADPNAAGIPIDPEAEEVQQLKSAAMPLLFQLREDQKSEVRSLARIIGLEKVASMI
jgi:hypothetical protein